MNKLPEILINSVVFMSLLMLNKNKRIKFPMVWERLVCDVRVEDLQPPRYEDALQIVQDHFIQDDPMCKGCNLNKDEESKKEFLEIVQFWMQDTQSFVAVEESTGRTVGILVGRVNYLDEHTKTMSRSRIYQSDVLRKMQNFLSHIGKQVDIYSVFKTGAFYKIHVWCVEPDYRDRGIGKALLRTAVEQTREYKISVVMGVFTGAISQHIARGMGFQSHLEILYWQWKENEESVFDDPGAGNSSADLMIKTIELPVEVETGEDQQAQENQTEK